MDLNMIKETVSLITNILSTLTLTILSIMLIFWLFVIIKDMKERNKRDAESDMLFRQAIRKLEEDTDKLIENAEKEAKKKKKKEISE